MLKNLERSRLTSKVTNDQKTEILDKEEKEILEEVEIDQLILSSLCADIMDEVMDEGSEYMVNTPTVPQKSKSILNLKRKKQVTK